MNKTIRAIHINSDAKTITEITISDEGSLKTMQELVGGRIELAVRLPKKDVVFVEEEGLLKSPENFFSYKGAHQPFAGNAVIIGTDEEGDNADVKITLSEVIENVLFADYETIRRIYKGVE